MSKTLKGKHVTTVQVHQDGGSLDGLTEIMIDDPLMKPGDEIVLFLHEFEPNQYYVEGGPQGRFVIRDNKVFSLAEADLESGAAELTEHLNTHGLTDTNFEKVVKESIN